MGRRGQAGTGWAVGPRIVLVGFDHRRTPIEIRDQLALTDELLRGLLRAAQGELGLHEVCALSTCNRFELYAVTSDGDRRHDAIAHCLTRRMHPRAQQLGLPSSVYRLRDAEAVEHLLRVACGLESMVLGEVQILGQVKHALELAHTSGTLGATLSQLLMRAIHAGKRARAETPISRHTTSVSHVAAALVEAGGDLARRSVLVIGAGEMALQAAKALGARGASNVTFVNRTFENAAALAAGFEARAVPWAELPAAVEGADAVVSATGAPSSVLGARTVAGAIGRRPERPLLIVDVAVPRDVEPAVAELAGVTLHDIDDLQGTLDANLSQRQAAVRDVEAIVGMELDAFLSWLDERQVAPVIAELRRTAEAIASAEIEQALRRLDGIDPNGEKVVQRMARRIVNKLLYAPTASLKSQAAKGDGTGYADVVRELFHLDASPAAAGRER